MVLAVLGCVLAMVSVVAVWGRNQVLDTDRYLRSVTPLASDPVIQDEVADKVAAAISGRLDAEAYARDALPKRAAFLAPMLGDGVDDFIAEKTDEFVRSDAFRALWVELNREGHGELVELLTGPESDVVVVADGRLQLDLGRVVEAVRSRLAVAGLTIVTSIPPITLVVDVADADGVERARGTVRTLDRVANVLPFVAFALLVGAVFVARRRMRAAALVALGLLVSMVVMRAALDVGANVAADQVSASVASTDAVHAYYHHLTSLLRDGVVGVGLVAALVGLVFVAVGPSVRAFRSGSFEAANWRTARGPVRLLVWFVAGVALLSAGWSDLSSVVWVVGLAVLALGLLALPVGRSGGAVAGGPGDD